MEMLYFARHTPLQPFQILFYHTVIHERLGIHDRGEEGGPAHVCMCGLGFRVPAKGWVPLYSFVLSCDPLLHLRPISLTCSRDEL